MISGSVSCPLTSTSLPGRPRSGSSSEKSGMAASTSMEWGGFTDILVGFLWFAYVLGDLSVRVVPCFGCATGCSAMFDYVRLSLPRCEGSGRGYALVGDRNLVWRRQSSVSRTIGGNKGFRGVNRSKDILAQLFAVNRLFPPSGVDSAECGELPLFRLRGIFDMAGKFGVDEGYVTGSTHENVGGGRGGRIEPVDGYPALCYENTICVTMIDWSLDPLFLSDTNRRLEAIDR